MGKGQCTEGRPGSRREGKEKIYYLSGEDGRGYIDSVVGMRRRPAGVKAVRWGCDAQTGHAKPDGAVGFPQVAGGGGRQRGGSMRAVSGAPLTGTTNTKENG